jgi:putative ABC transport system substrate-binding protein
MRRREFITLLGSTTAWPLAARAQQRTNPVIGFMSNIPAESYTELMPAFAQGLKESGFVEGQNVAFAYHWTKNEHDLPTLAAELIRREPALIVGLGGMAGRLCKPQRRP